MDHQTDTSGTGGADTPSAKERFSDHIRDSIRHENELTNQRIHWLVLLNGLAFAAIGLLWDKLEVTALLWGFVAMGVFSSLSCWLALWDSSRTRRSLDKIWSYRKHGQVSEFKDELAPVVGGRKLEDAYAEKDLHTATASEASEGTGAAVGAKKPHWFDRKPFRKLAPWKALPLIVIATWVFVIVAICLRDESVFRDEPEPATSAVTIRLPERFEELLESLVSGAGSGTPVAPDEPGSGAPTKPPGGAAPNSSDPGGNGRDDADPNAADHPGDPPP